MEPFNGTVEISNSDLYRDAEVSLGTQQQLTPNFRGTLAISVASHPVMPTRTRDAFAIGASFSPQEWRRLLNGEELRLDTEASANLALYQDTQEVEATKVVSRVRLEQLPTGQLRIRFQLDRGMFTEPEWREHDEKLSELVATFIPEFNCGICINTDGACIGGFDPNNESEYCSSFVEEFRLRELGLVD